MISSMTTFQAVQNLVDVSLQIKILYLTDRTQMNDENVF